MRRLILAALFVVGFGGAAHAACPAVATDCPSINANTGTFGGALTVNNGGTFTGNFTYTGTGSPVQPDAATSWNYTYSVQPLAGEARGWVMNANADYTTAAVNWVTLGVDSELNTIMGTFPFGSTSFLPQNAGGGEHQTAFYGHATVKTSPPMFGCTPGTNCPGTVFNQSGVIAFADNISTTELFSARSFLVHGPSTAKSFTVKGYSAGNGGTIDMWSALSSDDAKSGIDVSQAVGIIVGANVPYLNNGFGTGFPIGAVHASCGNRTDSATGWVAGNTLYLATPPFASLAMGPGNVITGTGGFVSAHLMHAVSSAPVAGVTPGGFEAYQIDGSAQTVGSQAAPINLTFTETCIPFVAHNFSSGSLATIGFVAGIGAPSTLLAQIDQGVDATAPLGNYIDIQIGGVPSVYVYGPPGRPSGMAVGFSSPPPSVPTDSLWVSGSERVDTLHVNTTGASVSMTTTGNVGIGTGHVGVGTRLIVKGPDTGGTTVFQLQDSNGLEIMRVQDNATTVMAGRAQMTTLTTSAAAFAGGVGTVSFGSTTVAATSCGSLASAAGCLVINVAGTARYVPFY
jgi:hypothetical protein